ncbi:MAG: hypothetical protein ACPHTH_00130 [Candidatus Poseidoniaceae archaeon]
MRSFKPILLGMLLLCSCIPIPTASADSVEVCCDSGPVELYLIGPAGSGEMSPFDVALSDVSEELTISDAIAQQQEIASWKIDPAWSGAYPSSTWEFAIDYSVENAGGVQINASVSVVIGGEEYVGGTDQSNSFLPSGEGTLNIDVGVDAGSISSSSKIEVILTAQTVVFSVPGTDAGLTFIWGGSGDDSSLTGDIPLVDLIIEEPVTEGMDVYISMIVASPFGQMTAAHAESLSVSVNSGVLSGDPIVTSSGDYVRLTWTWTSTTSGLQDISVAGSIQIQSGTPILTGTTTFSIETADTGSNGGGGFYPSEEPLRSDGGGSKLIASIGMELDRTDGFLTLERKIDLTIDGEMSYWMRWGMDNIGSDDSSLSQPLRIFNAGTVSDEDRRNRMIDDVERTEFESQMVNLAVTYMNDGMALELEELIGNDVQDLERISFSVDLQGKKNVVPHPLTLSITTLEIVEENKESVLLRNFIIVQPTPIWSSMDMSISIDTGMMASLTGANIKGEDSIDISQRRTPLGESIEISVENLKPSATFSFSAYPTSNLLNAPLSLSLITLAIVGGGMWFALTLTKNKRRGALWIEMILIPVVLLALFLGYNPFTVGAIAGISVALWTITAIASPKKKGIPPTSNPIAFPVIECPACGTPNSITTDERPFRLPCEGCGRVLKIVE